MTHHLNHRGYHVNRKRIQRLMRLMGIEAIYPKPKRSTINSEHRIYPYLLRDYEVTAANEVWSADITYIPMDKGFMYLVAILDGYSRYVITWKLSNSLGGQFCLDALHHALCKATPTIFNTDQGAQFTANAFTETVEAAGCAMSMNSVGRAIDNIYIERFWRSVKYEDVYQKLYPTAKALFDGLTITSGSIITNDLTRITRHRLRFIGAKGVHSDSQLSYLFFQYQWVHHFLLK